MTDDHAIDRPSNLPVNGRYSSYDRSYQPAKGAEQNSFCISKSLTTSSYFSYRNVILLRVRTSFTMMLRTIGKSGARFSRGQFRKAISSAAAARRWESSSAASPWASYEMAPFDPIIGLTEQFQKDDFPQVEYGDPKKHSAFHLGWLSAMSPYLTLAH